MLLLVSCQTTPTPDGDDPPADSGSPAPEETYDGGDPVTTETDEEGRLRIVSDTLGVEYALVVEGETGSPIGNAQVQYEELGDVSIILATDTATGYSGFRMGTPDALGVSTASTSGTTLEPQFVITVPVAIALVSGSIAGGVFGWQMSEANMVGKQVESQIDDLPSVDVDEGVVEMCATPDEFTHFMQTKAVQDNLIDEAYERATTSFQIAFVTAATAGVGAAGSVTHLAFEMGAAGADVYAIALELPHVAEAWNRDVAEEIYQAARSAYRDLGDLQRQDTLQVTLVDFRDSVLLEPGGYYWSHAIVSGFGCDQATYGSPIGSMTVSGDLTNVDPSGPATVTVSIDDPEAGVRVHINERVETNTQRFVERNYQALTNASGQATFEIPLARNSLASTLRVAVPTRFQTEEVNLDWDRNADRGDQPPAIYDFGIRGYEGRTGEPVRKSFFIDGIDDLATCEVDRGDDSGWRTFPCPSFEFLGFDVARTVSLPAYTYDTPGVYIPRLRITDDAGSVSETYMVLNVADQRGATPSIGTLNAVESTIDWTIDDADTDDLLTCSATTQGTVIWSEYPCARSNSTILTITDDSEPITFEVTDGQNTASRDIAIDGRTPTGVTFSTLDGDTHSLALDLEGNAWAWGSNDYGQLGDGSGSDQSTAVPVAMPADTSFTDIAAGGNHSVALDLEGNAWAWGSNDYGQLGDGSGSDQSTAVPVAMPPDTFFDAVKVGDYHSLALDADGNVWAWGRNQAGQVGGGAFSASSEPVLVDMPTGVTITTIRAGWNHSLALDAEGTIWAWGGGNHTMALNRDGTAWAWGRNTYGQLGDGSTTRRSAPVAVDMPSGMTFESLGPGGNHSLALDRDGIAWAWGLNLDGQLGDGTTEQRTVPVQVAMPTGTSFASLHFADYHSLALDLDGAAWAWGRNRYGQLGDGTTTPRSSPGPVVMP
ncbi:MAG: hypothetical protein LC667_05085 [Thioalkalivibrio sp.]|nr:hypothetical protein [Thioalkalivibrio sp.]